MYELMVIAKSDSVEDVSDKIEKFLKEIDAASVKIEKLGKKTLAYPIAKQEEAEYLLYNFDAEGKDLKTLADKIRLEQEAILRHMLIKVAKPQKPSKRQRAKEPDVEIPKEEVKAKPKVTVTTKSSGASKSSKKAVKSTKKGKK